MATEQTRDSLLRAESFVRRELLSFEDDLVRRLGLTYAQAAQELDAVAVEAFRRFGAPDTWSITDLQQPQRQAWLLDQITTRISALTQQVQGLTLDGAARSYETGYYTRGWSLSQAIPTNVVVNLPLLPEQAVLAAITFPYKDAGFFERFGDAQALFIQKVRRSITASQVLGEGIPQVRKRLADELGWDIRRRTRALARANKGNFARVEMIARTEMLRASNLGAATADEQNSDIVAGWEWITARDDAVDEDCARLDGNVYQRGERARPPLHPNCRCTTLPVLKPAREIGVPEIESEFPPRETYEAWAARTGRPPLPTRSQNRAASVARR